MGVRRRPHPVLSTGTTGKGTASAVPKVIETDGTLAPGVEDLVNLNRGLRVAVVGDIGHDLRAVRGHRGLMLLQRINTYPRSVKIG